MSRQLRVQVYDHQQRAWVTVSHQDGELLGMVRLVGAGVRATAVVRQHGRRPPQLDLAVDPVEGEALSLDLVELASSNLQARLSIRGVEVEP